MANNASLRGDERNIQDWINLICGVLLFVSPWALGFSGDLMAARAAWVGGVVIFLMGVVALVQFAEWEEWVALIVGALVVVAPWVVGIRSDPCGDVVMRRAWRHRRVVLDFQNPAVDHPAAIAGHKTSLTGGSPPNWRSRS